MKIPCWQNAPHVLRQLVVRSRNWWSRKLLLWRSFAFRFRNHRLRERRIIIAGILSHSDQEKGLKCVFHRGVSCFFATKIRGLWKKNPRLISFRESKIRVSSLTYSCRWVQGSPCNLISSRLWWRTKWQRQLLSSAAFRTTHCIFELLHLNSPGSRSNHWIQPQSNLNRERENHEVCHCWRCIRHELHIVHGRFHCFTSTVITSFRMKAELFDASI